MNVNPRNILIFSVLLVGLSQVNAQVPVVKSINKVILEGKVYYIHEVKPGQTLYSISKTYEISEAEIITENPGVDKSIPAGLVLKIPDTPKAIKTLPTPEPGLDKQEFIQHIIKEGETLYSLARNYTTTVQQIEKANPGLNYTYLPIGQMINVPKAAVSGDQQDFIYHKVKRKETIYGISKNYKITEEELKTCNPELREAFPRRGQILRIPKKSEPESVKAEETQPAIFIDTLVPHVPVKDSVINISYSYYMDSLSDISGRPINVAYLIPFNYSVIQETEALDSMKNIIEPDAQDKEAEYEDLLPDNKNFLEFFEGCLHAIDKLRQKGISVNVNFFDTKQSPERVREIINSNDFDKMDIIIGPFNSFNVEIVSDYSRQHHIPIISPFYNGSELTYKNPYLFQANPSLTTEFDQIASYLSTSDNKNIIFIHSTDSFGIKKINYLRSGILDSLALKGNLINNDFKDITYDNVNKPDLMIQLSNALSKSKENQVVIPETDEVFVRTLVSALFFQLKKYKIKVVGMPEWITFQQYNDDYSYFHKLELSFFTPYYYSYDSLDIKHFLKEFTREFFTEPVSLTNRGCPYAFIGYDLSYYFLNSMSRYGRHFIMHLHDNEGGQLLNDFRFEKTNNSGGFENRSLMQVKLMPDMSVEAHKIDSPIITKNPVSQAESFKE